VGNDSEISRTTVNCIIDERTLRELYLVPFEYAVRAGAWTIMAAYNRVNGVYATEHRGLLRELLKDEWAWDGLVISDWLAAHDTVACGQSGLDLEMPAGQVFGASLAAAVAAGLVPEAELDDKVERLLRLARRVDARVPDEGRHHPEPTPSVDHGEPRRTDLLTQACAAGFVLLKNDAGVLPLALNANAGYLAVIGPNAADPCFQGGGSASVNMGDVQDLIASLVDRFRGVAEVRHEKGCSPRTSFAPLERLDIRTTLPAAEFGITVDYHPDNRTTSDHPSRERRRSSFLSWHDGLPTFGDGSGGVVRISTLLTPARSGAYEFSVRGSGPTRVTIDGVEVAALEQQIDEDDMFSMFFSDVVGSGGIGLTAKAPVVVEAEMQHVPIGIPMFEVGCRAPEPEDLFERAVELAESAQAVILIVGTSADVEAESNDRTTTSLPGLQNELVEAVLDANPRTVVVVNAGSAVDMPWADNASTILCAWFPGHGFADALAGVLAGDLEPGGRLPITLAANPTQYPVYSTVPDSAGRIAYEESVFIGYRHFDELGIDPAFAFGHGLGYSRFTYGGLELSTNTLSAGDTLLASTTVGNVGDREGKDVVQLYISPPPSRVRRAPLELKGFEAVHLRPGESTRVTLRLDSRAFAHWDVSNHEWHIEPGDYVVHVGRSSRDLPLFAVVTIGGAALG